MAWAFDDEEVEIWTPGQDLPVRIVDQILSNGEMLRNH
jgi:hypothetical protein